MSVRGCALAATVFGVSQGSIGTVLQEAPDRLQITEDVEHVAPAGNRGQGQNLAGT